MERRGRGKKKGEEKKVGGGKKREKRGMRSGVRAQLMRSSYRGGREKKKRGNRKRGLNSGRPTRARAPA